MGWIYVSQIELETTPEFGYSFIDANGESHVKFHVDNCTSQENKDIELLVAKNPRNTVCMPPESSPIEVFGQDESVFSQFIFRIGPNLERGLFPASLGVGFMISAFVSRYY